MYKPVLYYGPDVGLDWEPEDVAIGKTYNGPPFFFKSYSTHDVFVTRSIGAMRAAIDLNKDLIFQEGKVHYSPMTKEWVLGTIRLSDAAYQLLKRDLWYCLSGVEAGPVSKEHVPTEWGPVSP